MQFDKDHLISVGWVPGANRPKDGSLVAYIFEPFMVAYIGVDDSENVSVAGRSGFTSWQPEVLCWYYLPF
jgi:hypothetical protein